MYPHHNTLMIPPKKYCGRGFRLIALLMVLITIVLIFGSVAINKHVINPAAWPHFAVLSGVMPALPDDGGFSRGATLRDPSTIIKSKDEFWVFYSGPGVMSYHSKDMVHWEPGPSVFDRKPYWVDQTAPGNLGDYWAPDIIHLSDRYFLYYAVSVLDKNTSAIGLATNPTLDPNDPAYKWTDLGVVVQSQESDDFNAIDPAIFHDEDGSLWLTFGSYWSGIKLVQLDPQTGKRITPDSPMTPLANNTSIEASYLYKHAGYYYLFVNWGWCLRGEDSTYTIRVGRSKNITGPYLDKDGVDMLLGGGSKFLGNKGRLIGPGHAGIIADNGKNWFSCHFEYDEARSGANTLALMPLQWRTDGWPEVDMSPIY